MTSDSCAPVIPEDQIDVWSVELDVTEATQQSAYTLLSPDERARAQQFLFPKDRARYIIRRATLRTLLGRYLGLAPGAVSLSYGTNGKPILPDEALHFNLSHSDAQAAYAFCACSPLGIDIQRVHPMPDLLSVASGFCSPAELEDLRSLSGHKQTTAFFRCWTRKEAFVKALGHGLSYPLERVDVSVGESARLLGPLSELTQWHFHTWDPGPQYLGALASQLATANIVHHSFTAL